MNLGRQIYSLLKRHSSVFVKGLGTFRRIRTSATFDAKRKVVLPPLSYIEFEQETLDGYDFTLFIQQIKQLERQEAEVFVQHEVNTLDDLINRDGYTNLEELGQLVLYGYTYVFKPLDLTGFQFSPQQDNYFEPAKDADSIVDDEKLEIELPSVEVLNESLAIYSTKEESPVNEAVSSLEGSTTEIASDTEEVSNPNIQDQNEYEEFEQPKRNRGIVYVLVSILAIITLGGIYYFSIVNNGLKKVGQFSYLDSLETNEDTVKSVLIDSVALAEKDSLDILQKDSLELINEVVQTAEPEPIADHKYTIVIGTHPKFEQAKAEAAEYQQKGFKHVRALPANLAKNRKRVIWDTYPTKELRDSALRYVQKNVKSDAWPAVL